MSNSRWRAVLGAWGRRARRSAQARPGAAQSERPRPDQSAAAPDASDASGVLQEHGSSARRIATSVTRPAGRPEMRTRGAPFGQRGAWSQCVAARWRPSGNPVRACGKPPRPPEHPEGSPQLRTVPRHAPRLLSSPPSQDSLLEAAQIRARATHASAMRRVRWGVGGAWGGAHRLSLCPMWTRANWTTWRVASRKR